MFDTHYLHGWSLRCDMLMVLSTTAAGFLMKVT